MSWLELDMIAALAGGELKGASVPVSGVSTDTRSLQAGELFIALSGPNFDGHDYVRHAIERGAVAALVSRRLGLGVPEILVEDTRLALGNLAAGWRQSLKPVLVGLTGSNGKTTVKEMISAILSRAGQVLATPGNLNNDIGMPLTLLRLRPEHDFAVIEMGANHLGEIRYLAEIADPDIGLVNNAGPAHLEGFGDLDGVARGKGELFESLRTDAVAVINRDDVYADYWQACLDDQRALGFGMSADADIRGRETEQGFELCYQGDSVLIDVPLPGRHNRMNALAAAATAIAAGISLEDIKQGLESMQSVAGRLQLQEGISGSKVIDDTYNANPASLQVAIDYLAGLSGQRWLVLGDMGELGASGAELHAEAGRQARAAGLDRFYTLGDLAAKAAEAYGDDARVFADKNELIQALREGLDSEVTVLVKGSRSMAMEEVVRALVNGNWQASSKGREHAA